MLALATDLKSAIETMRIYIFPIVLFKLHIVLGENILVRPGSIRLSTRTFLPYTTPSILNRRYTPRCISSPY